MHAKAVEWDQLAFEFHYVNFDAGKDTNTF